MMRIGLALGLLILTTLSAQAQKTEPGYGFNFDLKNSLPTQCPQGASSCIIPLNAAKIFGMTITQVACSSEAHKRGLRPGDEVTSLNGVQIEDMTLQDFVLFQNHARNPATPSITLTIKRDGKPRKIEIPRHTYIADYRACDAGTI